MKKWTFLVATALMAGATPVLTGCIDNEEPEGITILRGAKAELLKAKAAVEAAKVAQVEAEAAYMLAQSEVQKALAASEQAKAKILEAQAKQEEAKAKLLETQNEAAIAALQEQIKEYERIQKEWEAKMAAEATKAEQALAEWELQYKQMEIAYQQALIELATAKATLTQKQQGILAPYVAELQAKKDIYDEKAEAVRLAQRAVLEATQEVETNEADKEYYQRELQWALKAAQYAKEGADKALERANAELAEFQGMEPSALQQKKAALEAELQELGKTIADMSVAAAEELRKMEEGEIAQYNDAAQKENDNYFNKEYTLKEFTYTVGEGLPTQHFGEYTLDELTYTLASPWNYENRKAELENLYQQFVSWTRDENDNAWTNERIAKLEDDLKKNEEAVAKLKASWKEAVDAYHKDPATVVADPSVITGYTELCAAVDAYNTVATSLNEKNATMQTIRQAMSDAWAEYYKAISKAQEEYSNTDVWQLYTERKEALEVLRDNALAAYQKNPTDENLEKAYLKAQEDYEACTFESVMAEVDKKYNDAIAAAEKTKNEILTAKKAEQETAQAAIDSETDKLNKATNTAMMAYYEFKNNASKSDNPNYGPVFEVMANDVDIYNISNKSEIKDIEYNEDGWTGWGHWYRTPATLDKSTLTELNKAALTEVIIYRSNALYGTAIYSTNEYGDFDARLVELTIDDIKAELAKEEGLIGQSYIDVCNYNYGLVGQSLAIQTQIDLAKAWLSNDSQVKALIDQTKAAIDEMTAEYEAAVEAHETEVERLEGVWSDIEDKLQASIDEINKKRAELQPIQHLLNAVVHAIEDYKANGSAEYSQEDIDYAVATLEKKVKDIEKQVYDAETAVMTAQRNLEGWNNGSLDKLAIAKNNLEDAEAALAVAKENMEAAQAALTSVIEALATDSATTENL